MAVAAWLVWMRAGFRNARAALSLFAVQLLLNAAWTPVFFGLRRPGAAFVVIVLLWAAIAATAISFLKHGKAAAALLVPYLLWVTFAAALNYRIWRLSGG
jgi:tryptophan-rich sensory protein